MYDFISDFWKIIKKYAELPTDQTEWDQLTDEASELTRKYRQQAGDTPETRFFRKCVVDWLEYISEREIIRINEAEGRSFPGSRPP